ncbi:MAG: 50S ribosomal protein L32 [Planctomycetes bacterium]|nr:50S ribosomal protein L32 [Planctomycetota bacterium]
MPLPKRRHSNSRTRKRRTHDALERPPLSVCPQCNQTKRPHRVCSNCGHYHGRMVVKRS